MKFGAVDITKIYLGNTEVSKAYLGDALVHGSSVETMVVGVFDVTTTSSSTFIFNGGVASQFTQVFVDGVQMASVSNKYKFNTLGHHTVKYILANDAELAASSFNGCPNLSEVFIPASVTSIGQDAFRNCTRLSKITVDGENTKYDSRDNCNAVIETSSNTLMFGCKDTVIPNSVTSLYQRSFIQSTALTNMVIPSSVTSIGLYCFYQCSNLVSLTFLRETPPTLPTNALGSTSGSKKLYVPADSVETYKSTWTSFANIIEAIPT